jgi:hypothetical protein
MGASPKAPKVSDSQKASEARQAAEFKKTQDQLAAKKAALQRRSRGRASLISGEETGIADKTLLG